MRKVVAANLIALLVCGSVAQAQSSAPARRHTVIWTVSGGAAGFGVGLWAGLSAFDDAVNSDRKVWTSAAVGAGLGALAGYLIGRARNGRGRVPTAAAGSQTERPRLSMTAGDLTP